MSEPDSRPGVYAEVSANYRAVDDLRLRLLGLLPLATGTGILLLVKPEQTPGAVLAVAGVLGIFATISLFFYELHGVEKCAHFIHRGQQLEESLGIRGSFTARPHNIFGVVSELLPSAVIYPASLAGWLYVALAGLPDPVFGLRAATVSTVMTLVTLLVALAAAGTLIKIRETARIKEWEGEDKRFAESTSPDE